VDQGPPGSPGGRRRSGCRVPIHRHAKAEVKANVNANGVVNALAHCEGVNEKEKRERERERANPLSSFLARDLNPSSPILLLEGGDDPTASICHRLRRETEFFAHSEDAMHLTSHCTRAKTKMYD